MVRSAIGHPTPGSGVWSHCATSFGLAEVTVSALELHATQISLEQTTKVPVVLANSKLQFQASPGEPDRLSGGRG